MKDGQPISGATNSDYQAGDVDTSVSGSYSCQITDTTEDSTCVAGPALIVVAAGKLPVAGLAELAVMGLLLVSSGVNRVRRRERGAGDR